MKLNAYSAVGNRPNILAIILIFISVLLVFSSCLLLFNADKMKVNFATSNERLKHLQEKSSNFDVDSLPSEKDLINVKNRSNKERKLSVLTSNKLLKSVNIIEKNIPDEAWISRINFRRDTNFIEIISEATNGKHLNNFLKNIENSTYFTKVLLKKQGKRTSNKLNLEQYTIHLHISSQEGLE